MYSDDDLDGAVKAGVLGADVAADFRAYVAGARKGFGADEEHFRLITGFNDIFVVIASLLLLAAVGWIGSVAHPAVGGVGVAAGSWLLAEFFVRQRHMALPAIVLLGSFIGGVFAATVVVLGHFHWSVALAAGISAVAAAVHWTRFHVPITVAAGVAAAVTTVVAAVLAAAPSLARWTNVLVFAAGIAVFLLALRWDASDAARQTRRSDVAFWLHLLAAPLIVHPVFLTIGATGGAQALIIVGLYVVIGFVSLAIDRRALMVSALGYVLYAFAGLMKQFGFVSLSFAITALVIGALLLMLSAFWQQSRAFAVQWLPAGLQQRLPRARA